jgi:BlaI family penicillinase repressor
MRAPKSTLTGQELEIMKQVWRLESATVRQVYEALLEQRRIAYTTVMTMMNILEQKGFLKKSQDDRAYVYSPAQPQKQVVGSMVREFVNRVFNGSAEPLLLHLVEDQHLTEKDLDEIRKSIRSSRKGKSA